MIVFSNQQLGPAAEVLVSPGVATEMLRDTAAAANATAEARWERELATWLAERASRIDSGAALDIGDIAWTPENFERQRRFLLAAIERASAGSANVRALTLWARLVEAHPRDSVQVGRRWSWQPTA